jgi:hypothetical protein
MRRGPIGGETYHQVSNGVGMGESKALEVGREGTIWHFSVCFAFRMLDK